MILDVSRALVDVIHQATPDLGDWVELNSLSSSDKTPTTNKAVLALLALEPEAHSRNMPLVEGTTGLVRAPMPLKLHYLITHFGDHDEAQLRLARVVQAFHTTPILTAPMLQPPLAGAVESVTVRLLSPSADERNQIWGLLGRPGRVALFYGADVAPVAVLEREGIGRVRTHEITYRDVS